MRRLLTVHGGALAVAVCLFTAAGAGAHGAPSAVAAARSCKPPKYPGVGYFTSLKVSNTGCPEGKRVALAYYRCRTRGGQKAGRCRGGVLGYRCSERRNTIPTEIDARVTCKKGRVTVIHTYQQDT